MKHKNSCGLSFLVFFSALLSFAAAKPLWLKTGRFNWICSKPLFYPPKIQGESCYSIKDPSIVYYRGLWHLFCTIRAKKHSHFIEYLRFPDWKSTSQAERKVLRITQGYFCAPQVFFFRPQKKWYLIYQVIEKSRKPPLQPAFSTTRNIEDPHSWSPGKLLFEKTPPGIKRWIDFWVIRQGERMFLFFTTFDGRLFRSYTRVERFPSGWSRPELALKADIFEAAHVYNLKGMGKFLALIEAIGPRGRRYYKAFITDRLESSFTPLASTWERAFASPSNVKFENQKWTDSFSHGELLRAGYDERLLVDPFNLKFLFQGVKDEERRNLPYGRIPWRLGLLKSFRGAQVKTKL